MNIYLKYTLLIIFTITTSLYLSAQQILEGKAKISALQVQLSNINNDTAKVKLLNDISYEYNKISPYDGIKYATESIALAQKLHWDIGLARANSAMGANYYSLSDYPNAYKYWLIALEMNEKTGNQIGIANHLHNIGNIFFSQKNYEQALQYYTQGLKRSEEIGNTKILTNSYTAIGNVYIELKDYTKALQYHSSALEIDKKQNLTGNIAADEINIGSIYNEQHRYAEALEILYNAAAIKNKIGDKTGTANAYSLIGKVFINIAVDSSLAHKQDSSRHNLKNAIAYLDSAILIDKSIGYLDNMQKSYASLSAAQEMLNDATAALNAFKQYSSIKDSIFSISKQTEIFNLEKKAEIEEQNREIEKAKEEQERKEYIQIAAVCCFIVTLLFVLLLLRGRKINPQIIDVLCTFSALIFFEFINLLLHGQIEKLTDHNLILSLLCLLVVAAIIIPIHHKLEHWLKKKIGHHKQEPKAVENEEMSEQSSL